MWGFKRKTISNPPPGWNYPANHPSTGGNQGPWTPKGASAPALREREEDHGSLAFPQRLTERMVAFAPRLPIQTWLRQQRTVLVTPLEVDANKLAAPGGPNRQNFGASDDAGWSTRTSPATNAPSIGGESETAWRQSKYLRDYSLQTYMARARVGTTYAPPAFQSVQALNDINAQVEMNGVYSVLNANLASQYMGLRAPTQWENLGNCS